MLRPVDLSHASLPELFENLVVAQHESLPAASIECSSLVGCQHVLIDKFLPKLIRTFRRRGFHKAVDLRIVEQATAAQPADKASKVRRASSPSSRLGQQTWFRGELPSLCDEFLKLGVVAFASVTFRQSRAAFVRVSRTLLQVEGRRLQRQWRIDIGVEGAQVADCEITRRGKLTGTNREHQAVGLTCQIVGSCLTLLAPFQVVRHLQGNVFIERTGSESRQYDHIRTTGRHRCFKPRRRVHWTCLRIPAGSVRVRLIPESPARFTVSGEREPL